MFSRVSRTRIAGALILFSGLVFQSPASAASAQIKAVRYWQSPESTRVVFDLSGPVRYALSQNGQNLSLELPDAGTALSVASVPVTSDLISKVRTETVGGGLRVVLELKRPARPKAFVLKPYQQYGDRLVVDLYDAAQTSAPASHPAPAAPATGQRDIVIAIDAGHGGDDPGAIGPKGSQEKDVTLAIAKRLAEGFNQRKGMKAVLVRTGDYFIPLARRPELAREKKADMFISVHADGFNDKRARGSSVWTLSGRRARSEMGRWLENSENASDLIGGTEAVSLDDKDKVLAEVLLDLSMTHSMSASYDVGKDVLKRLGKFSPLHKREVQQASFKVLTSPDIPSILVETAFISNPTEEKLLKSPAHQDKLVEAIVAGVHGYMLRRPPPGAEYALKGGMPEAPALASAPQVAVAPAPPVAQATALPLSGQAVTQAVEPPRQPLVASPPPAKPARPLYLNTIASSLEYAKRKAGAVPAKPAAASAKTVAARHKVRTGESLSLIAARYKVSLAELRNENRIAGDVVRIGQVLVIPN